MKITSKTKFLLHSYGLGNHKTPLQIPKRKWRFGAARLFVELNALAFNHHHHPRAA
jgi:hypothetical protein